MHSNKKRLDFTQISRSDFSAHLMENNKVSCSTYSSLANIVTIDLFSAELSTPYVVLERRYAQCFG